VNSIILTGRLTADPDLRDRGDNLAMTRFRVAVHRRDGSDDVDFFTITAWGPTAVAAASFLTKGRLVGVGGSLRQQRWTDNSGAEHERVEILARTVEFLDQPKPSGHRHDGGDAATPSQPVTPDEAAPMVGAV
jgi:single-strand DNA-binding protein